MHVHMLSDYSSQPAVRFNIPLNSLPYSRYSLGCEDPEKLEYWLPEVTDETEMNSDSEESQDDSSEQSEVPVEQYY